MFEPSPDGYSWLFSERLTRVFQKYFALSLDLLEAGTRSAVRRHNFVRLMSSVDLVVFHDGLT